MILDDTHFQMKPPQTFDSTTEQGIRDLNTMSGRAPTGPLTTGSQSITVSDSVSRSMYEETEPDNMPSHPTNSLYSRFLAPVLLVVVIWGSMSCVTTFYLSWLERSRQRIRVENVVSMRSAETIQTLIWAIAAALPPDEKSLADFRSRLTTIQPKLDENLIKLKESVSGDEERRLLLKVESGVSEFRKILQQSYDSGITTTPVSPDTIDYSQARVRVLAIADQISDAANQIYGLNRNMADQENERQKSIGRFVSAMRLTTLIAGPVVGVLLGWRLAGLLHRSMARISVTLREAGSSVDNELGTIAIEASGDVDDVQHQAEQVANRMRQVSQELQVARGEVLRSERLAAVGELAAGVAHEIRNPLTSIKLLLQHAVRQATGPRLDEAKINLILEEIDRMELIIQGLLDFSRPPRLNRVRHDLRETLKRALNLVEARAHQQNIEIITQAGDIPLTVDGDTEKLHQVLVNLLINAIEEMEAGGRLTIDARLIAGSESLLKEDSPLDSRHTQGNLIQVVIRDTGNGIPVNVMPRLFEPFATTKERGTGLGLAVSRRIVQEHSGRIGACNHPDGGAEFQLEIPAADQSTGQPERSAQDRQFTRSTL